MASLTFPQRREKKTASRKKKQRCENKSIVAHVFLATPSRHGICNDRETRNEGIILNPRMSPECRSLNDATKKYANTYYNHLSLRALCA